jgi:SET domain-containing protein
MSRPTYVKKSCIHGFGVFARRPIRRGGYIGRYHGNNTTRNGRYVLWVIQPDGEHLGINGRNGLRFLNHSRRPNAEFVGEELFATRVIHPDEEITIDYGEDWSDTD